MGSPDRLSVRIEHASGALSRWAADEPDSANVPQGISFGTSIPGGHKDAQCSLSRRIDRDYPDLGLFDTVVFYGPGGDVAFEGRIQQLPRSHGDSFGIQVGAVGWAAHLRDDPSFKEVYRDRDLSKWREPSRPRLSGLISVAVNPQTDGGVVHDETSGLPALEEAMAGGWTGVQRNERWYDPGAGLLVDKVYYDWERNPNVAAHATDANWGVAVATHTQDDGGTFETTGDLHATGTQTGTFIPATKRRFLNVYLDYAISGGVAQARYAIYWRQLIVYGTHGLTVRGTEPDAGLYASDVVADIVGRAAPKLTFTTGTGGTIEPTSFAVPHLVFADPVTAEDAILETNKFHLYEWGVWEGRRFFYRPPDPDRLTWTARLSEGAHLDLEGAQADDLYSGVVVTYPTFDGQTKAVGPPGSGADGEDATLEDTNVANPVVAHGLRRWKPLQVSAPTSQAGAISIGAVWLAEQKIPQRRGTLVVRPRQLGDVPMVEHPTAGRQPIWKIRAGDWVRIADHPADDPRRIIETRYDHDSRTLTASLENTVWKLEALLERLNVGLVGR